MRTLVTVPTGLAAEVQQVIRKRFPSLRVNLLPRPNGLLVDVVVYQEPTRYMRDFAEGAVAGITAAARAELGVD